MEPVIESVTAGDGYAWKYRRYAATGVQRGQVVCVHGIQSHGGWYVHSCQQWSAAGFGVFFLDRRGAGLNEAERGDAPSFRRLLDDIAEFLRTRRQRDSTPLFLVGISWGGKLATALQRRHPGLVDGLILLCPGFVSLVRPALGQRLAIAWARLVAPRRLFPIPLNDPDLFTASPAWQQFIADDSLGLRLATARLLVESVRLDIYLRLVPKHVRVPVLLLLAEKDRIIANGPTRRYVARFASPEKEVIEYPGAHHTLEFEPDPERFIGDVRQWLERHTPAVPASRGRSSP